MLQQCLKVIIFGHGLYEKALKPYIGMTAKCLLFVAKENSEADVDMLVAQYLQEKMDYLRPSLLAPLPILGIPGWWEANSREEFYRNKSYFRD